jgi:hypothetical protein
MWLRGISWLVQVKVNVWIQEQTTFSVCLNTTPPEQAFHLIDEANTLPTRPLTTPEDIRYVAVDFDMLYSIWERMKAGDRKNNLEAVFKASPCYIVRQKQLLLATAHNTLSESTQLLQGGNRSKLSLEEVGKNNTGDETTCRLYV